MARPLIATKLYVPKARRGLATRSRLTAQLLRGAEARLTLLSAPAGFGKTTLLADWLREIPDDNRSVAWLSLDPADNEPASFWTYVVTALHGAVPGVGSAALELITSTPVPTDLLLTTLLNNLAASPGEVWLVLDDYHLVDDHEIGQGMTFLLEHLPPQVHVVLSTRADPDLPLARWRVRGELVDIRAADLRFTPLEVGSYLNGQTRTGGAGFRPRDPLDRAGGVGDPTPPAGSDDVRLAEGAARRRSSAQPGAAGFLGFAAWAMGDVATSAICTSSTTPRWLGC